MGSHVLPKGEAAQLFGPYTERLEELHARWFPDTVDIALLVSSPEVLIFDGDQDFDSFHLEAHTPCVIIDGDLRVRGELRQDPRAGALSVLGELHAEAVLSDGEIFVAGDLIADDVMYGCSEQFGTRALGKLRAPRLIADGRHDFAAAAGIDAGVFLDVDASPDTRAELEEAIGAPVRCGRFIGARRTGLLLGGVKDVSRKLAGGEPLFLSRFVEAAKAPRSKPPATKAAKKRTAAKKRPSKKDSSPAPKKPRGRKTSAKKKTSAPSKATRTKRKA